MQNVMHIAPNAGHTAQNDGRTMQHAQCLPRTKGGLEEPPGLQGTPPTPIL